MNSIFWHENVTGIGTSKTETKTDSALDRNICFLIRSTPKEDLKGNLKAKAFLKKSRCA